jgi:hypothetical protein
LQTCGIEEQTFYIVLDVLLHRTSTKYKCIIRHQQTETITCQTVSEMPLKRHAGRPLMVVGGRCRTFLFPDQHAAQEQVVPHHAALRTALAIRQQMGMLAQRVHGRLYRRE